MWGVRSHLGFSARRDPSYNSTSKKGGNRMERFRKANKGQRTVMILLVVALLATAGAIASSRVTNALAGGSTCTATSCTWNGNGSDAANCQNVAAGTPI